MTTDSFPQRLLDSPLATVADYYARHLNDAAHSFLAKNCLSADDSLRVGFSDRTLGKQIPVKQLKAGRDIRAKLKQHGILKASGHESLRGFVTVPLTDLEGNILTTGKAGISAALVARKMQVRQRQEAAKKAGTEAQTEADGSDDDPFAK